MLSAGAAVATTQGAELVSNQPDGDGRRHLVLQPGPEADISLAAEE